MPPAAGARAATGGTYDVAVIGGGVIGLAAAYELARQGAQVVVLERERPGTGASTAAAGMLAPGHEAGTDPVLYELGIRSCRLWPEFARAVEDAAGRTTGYTGRGIAVVATGDDEAASLRERAGREGAGRRLHWIAPDALPPYLAGFRHIRGALLFEEGGHVDPVATVRALAAAFSASGTLWTGTEVVGFRHETAAGGRRLVAVQTPHGEVRAHTFVLAGGVFNASLAAHLGIRLPVVPVKGQILAVEPPPGLHPFLRGQVPVFGGGVYLVPRLDGRLLIGATEEPAAGYDRSVTLGAITHLALAAQELAPDLKDARWLEARSGLRPGTPDRRPLLGLLPGYTNVVVAAGHYRNGILLAPLTGRIVADLCQGREPEVDLTPLDPGRFGTPVDAGSVHSLP
ncbi:glycine oxidase ThiO [Thermaerobacter marianensis DSM 12885]|uniref:glycine oxidase n=1 Tax=Thermaerobacter marianensis (strain ATCC 700841 / DSM 12885 / JCM 10246 / 7p75a) TaxID=644966 RepID=E6SIE6_THEM7|nr:glycine oxidase ThiO [Thermaerobacter marianensis]ADU51957.1 glycine oxidase ThiO [Thermaerobacter marianensis DSM 12885]